MFLRLLFLSLLLNSCRQQQVNPESSAPEQAKIYPHSAEFKTTAIHGAEFLKNNSTCTSCHQKDIQVLNSDSLCMKCHQTFPHAKDFKIGKIHGQAFGQNRDKCLTCHGSQTKEKTPSCKSCHDFPHSPAFSLSQNHGQAFIKSQTPESTPLVACATCHESTHENNTLPTVSCISCHIQMPHTEEFKGGDANHGEMARTYKGKCLECHQDYTRNMPNSGEAGGCKACHSGDIKIEWKEE